MNELLAVETVLRRILTRVKTLPAEHVPIAHALGRVLARDVHASEASPPFANSSMDGYAVRAADVANAAPDSPVRLAVIEDIQAGDVPRRAVGQGQAARIMTGAPMPEGADAVVPVEDTGDEWASTGDAELPDHVSVKRAVGAGGYVRLPGENITAGTLVLRGGTRLRPQDIGVLASLGHSQPAVIRRARVAIIATGNELIELDQPSTPGKIRNSNTYMLAALVAECGGEPVRLPVARDTLDDVRQAFEAALDHQPDMIISSAGVSVGTHDVVRAVVYMIGHVDLWRVNVRPGKPLAFGQVQGVPFFGLPGNPVSAMVTFDIFARPALLRQMGHRQDTTPVTQAVLGETLRSDGRRTYARVRLEQRDDGTRVAYSTGTQSSGALMSMVLADGLLIIPEGVTEARAGERYMVRLLRDVM